jgi:hypothetical protein
MWATLALATTLNLAPAQGGLEFKNVRPTYGFLGPERKDNSLLPGDVYVLAFDIEGLMVGKDDRILYAMGVELVNAKGESQFKKDPQDLEAVNTLGGSRVPAFANAQIGLDTAPGKYTLIVTVNDRAAKTSKQLRNEFEVMPLRFGLTRFGFSSATGEAVPPLGAVGQTYYLNFTVVGGGFAEKTGQPDITAEVVVTDEAGKSTLNQPIQARVQNVRDEFLKLKVIPMNFPVSLNRPGKFKLSVTVTDKVGGKKAEQSIDLNVTEPK